MRSIASTITVAVFSLFFGCAPSESGEGVRVETEHHATGDGHHEHADHDHDHGHNPAGHHKEK